MPTDIKIPKHIHFIWAGGEKLLPPDSIDTIMQWAKQNPDWRVILWVDKETFIPNRDIIKEYQKLFNLRYNDSDNIQAPNIQGVNITSNHKLKNAPNHLTIIILDIKEYDLKDKNIDYEISRITPNYGASSDLLRYRILHKFGGAYFDSDVAPGKTNLSEIELSPEKHTLYVEHHSQNNEAKAGMLADFSTLHIGNDTFITTKGNPLMESIYQAASNNYDYNKKNNQLYLLQRAHESFRNSTIRFTGPYCVREAIDNHKKPIRNLRKFLTTNLPALKTSLDALVPETTIELANKVVLKRIRDGSKFELAKPLCNAASWLKEKGSPITLEKAYEILEKTIAFEAKNFKVFRLDDHIKDLINVSKKLYLPLSEEEAFQKVIKLYEEKSNSHEVKYVQITGNYEQSIEYCKLNNLPTIFNLSEDDVVKALIYQVDLYKVNLLEKANVDKSKIADRYKNNDPNDITVIEKRKQWILEAYERLKVFSDKINNFKYPEAARKLLSNGLKIIDKLYDIYTNPNSENDKQKLNEIKQTLEDLTNKTAANPYYYVKK